jgi:menaquinone-dependent protoporphyrinogen oxidase
MGNWVPEMLEFVEGNAAALKTTQAAFFSVCMSVKDEDPAKRDSVKTFMDKPKAVVTPAAEAVFMGAMNFSKLSLIERMMMKAMKSPVGDFREWDVIRGWGKDLPARLGIAG